MIKQIALFNRFILIILVFTLKIFGLPLFECGHNLYAQEPRYPYREYRDRKEGIIEDIEFVSGQKLVLISANIENQEPKPGKLPGLYYLGFYLNKPARLNIEVKENRKSYLMRPSQQVYSRGPNIFAWPSKISAYYKISLMDLFPLVESYDSEISTIIPIALFYKKPTNKELVYNFCFIPQSKIKVVEYKIYSLTSNELVASGKLNDLEMDKEFYIQWNSTDRRNANVSDGDYLLNIKSFFEPPLGSTFSPPVTLNYKFYHYAELLRRELFTSK